MNYLKEPKTLALYGVTLLTLCGSLLALTLVFSEHVAWNHPASQGATITVTGEGKTTAIPDIATVTFTVDEVASTVPDAQKAVEAKITAAKASLKALNIDDKDIKTTSYTVNPRYETQGQIYCITVPCPTPKTVITGYEVAETISVKVRKIDSAGAVIAAVGKANITQVSGPDFTVDDIDAVNTQAKSLAIQDARAKAQAIANSLNVDLGRIVGYSENGSTPYPMMARASYSGKGGAEDVSLSTGQTDVDMTVSITYEIH